MKIIDLTSRRLALKSKNTVFYLTHDLKWFSTLQSDVPLQVIPIQTMECLKTYCGIKTPDLLVIDKDFCGKNSELITQVQFYSVAPIILIAPKEKKSSRFIKQAYVKGIIDVLFDPVSKNEWQEMLVALLRVRENQTLKH